MVEVAADSVVDRLAGAFRAGVVPPVLGKEK